jgi:hypothetical protein
MKMKAIHGFKWFAVLAFAVLVVFGIQDANAAAVLRLSDGINPVVTVYDGGAGDLSPLTGMIIYSGVIGNWSGSVSTGLTKPILPTPQMDLNTIDFSTQSGGALTIEFSDNGFTDLLGIPFQLAIGGTTQGSVSAQAYFDVSNTLFGTDTLITNLGTFTGPAFSAVGSTGTFPSVGPYSLYEIVTITHGSGTRVSSLDASLTPVPEPGTMMLLGSGLIGLAGWGRKKFRK